MYDQVDRTKLALANLYSRVLIEKFFWFLSTLLLRINLKFLFFIISILIFSLLLCRTQSSIGPMMSRSSIHKLLKMFALFPRFFTRRVSRAHRFCCIFFIYCSFVPSTVFILQSKSFDRYGRCDDFLIPFLLCLDTRRTAPKESSSVGKLTSLISAAHNLLIVAHRWSLLTVDVARRFES